MTLQVFLTRVPLLLSYPTIILSSSLMIASISGSDTDNTSNARTMLLARLIFLPFFSASSFTALGFSLKIIHKQSLLFPVFLIAYFTGILTFVLGSTQATCLSLLIVNMLCSGYYDNSTNIFSIKTLIMTFLPFCIISTLSNHFSEEYYLFTPMIAYTVVFILLYLVKLTILPSLIEMTKSKETNNSKNSNQLTSTLLLVLQVSSFLCIYVISSKSETLKLQLLMVFVFIGCLVIFFLSLQDLLTYDITVNADGDQVFINLHVAWITKYTFLLTGSMCLILQYLSFNIKTKNSVTDVLSLSFIITSEIMSYYHTNGFHHKSSYHSHAHAHSQVDHGNQYSHEQGHSHSHSVGSIFREMASNKETRSIFSFLLLNTTFMFVQLLYSFRSKSLGLLSDSLHMALDCTSLMLGLLAGILSKRPPSDKFPFGLGYLETITGFTNGILLIGIVSGIFIQSIGRIFNPIHIEKTNELLVVASLGLLVNFVGLFAFDHGGHGGESENDNMRGVFLHVLADTLGSVGVIISTLLIKFTHWHIFDPIASLLIASLILLSAIPLVKSTSSNILLKLDEKKHNTVKNALNKISTTPGISGYASPRFWPTSTVSSGHSHGHSHVHEHENNEEKGNEHEHENEHEHGHVTNSEYERTRKKKITLMGYIHIQYVEGENSTIIKKRVEKIFESFGIKAWVQVESNDSNCWCRSSSYATPIIVPQTITSN